MKTTLYLCRHGETSWTVSGRHTGSTDISLTEKGKAQALSLGKRLRGIPFEAVYSSPLKRALETCQLAGLSPIQLPQAREWDYGAYEGLTSQEIRKQKSDWDIFANGAPNGETPEQIALRADAVLERLLKHQGTVALFSHGHFLRALAARWLNLNEGSGQLFSLSVASVSILGYEGAWRVIRLWNETPHC
jgi:probable phosphoglycerate mutase